jgi:hypothetical protein
MGIRDQSDRTPIVLANAYVERLIGSIRRECLDHMIVFGEPRSPHDLSLAAFTINYCRI